MAQLTIEEIWRILDEIKDPEIPAVSMVEMGMIRSVGLDDGAATVVVAPTFIGCPALGVMRAEIEERLLEAGAENVQIRLSFSPPWTGDWITPQGRQKLKAFGLAPPPPVAGRLEAVLEEPVACPYCDSTDTRLTNDFGSSLCRAIYFCDGCRQPFERFKPI